MLYGFNIYFIGYQLGWKFFNFFYLYLLVSERITYFAWLLIRTHVFGIITSNNSSYIKVINYKNKDLIKKTSDDFNISKIDICQRLS